MPFAAFAMRGESQAHEYALVLGGYHNFMVPFGTGFHSTQKSVRCKKKSTWKGELQKSPTWKGVRCKKKSTWKSMRWEKKLNMEECEIQTGWNHVSSKSGKLRSWALSCVQTIGWPVIGKLADYQQGSRGKLIT